MTRYLLDGEKKALETINNPYVCKGLKVVEDENYCYMIMEYYDQGTLQDYILKKGISQDIKDSLKLNKPSSYLIRF